MLIAWTTSSTVAVRRKPPKIKRGWRTIEPDDAIVAVLLAERERHQRIQASIPDGVTVDLGLIKLPSGALMFPAIPDLGPRLRRHRVAQRIGDDPAVPLRNCAKRERSKLTETISAIASGFLGHEENGRGRLLEALSPSWPQSSFCSHCVLRKRELSD